jgi:SAM-dependent methyltransferase
MRLNSFQGKRLLALARGGDYAHAGETESIDLVWNRLPKTPTQQVLDAGCGRGGTAAYIQRAGWGKVTGIDIEGESIQRGRDVYPEITSMFARSNKPTGSAPENSTPFVVSIPFTLSPINRLRSALLPTTVNPAHISRFSNTPIPGLLKNPR